MLPLRTRLIAALSVFSIAMGTLAYVVFVERVGDAELAARQLYAESTATMLASAAGPAITGAADATTFGNIVQMAASDPRVVHATLARPNETVLATSGTPGPETVTARALVNDGQRLVGIVRVDLTLVDVHAAIATQKRTAAAIALACLLFGMLLYLNLARTIVGPIELLARLSGRFTGSTPVSVIVDGPPEVRQLARTLSEVTTRLCIRDRQFDAILDTARGGTDTTAEPIPETPGRDVEELVAHGGDMCPAEDPLAALDAFR